MPECQLVKIITGILKDAVHLCPGYTERELILDLKTVSLRRQFEGESFFTNTLSGLKKHLLLSIETGAFTPLASFKRRMRGGSLPCFVHGLYNAVFDESGVLLNAPCTQSIRVLLQLVSAFSKYEGACDENKLKQRQIKAFVSLDEECSNVPVFTPLVQAVAEYAADLVHNIFKHFAFDNIVPRPGSGAEANHLRYYERWVPTVVPSQANRLFDYSTYHYVSDRHLFDEFKSYMDAELESNIAARLEAVPKDTFSWRLICIVANGYMYLQQGLKDDLYKHIEGHYMTSGHVNFTDQNVNGVLAYQSSIDDMYATLDMKDASDRVMKWHIQRLFKRVPKLRDALLALSEQTVSIPNLDGTRREIACNKFAPMGSALCFPVMSVVHYALLRAAVFFCAKPHDAIKHSQDVYVYGDDLLTRSQYAADVIDIMQAFGLKFNPNKCYIKSRFRESCGIDAYDGIIVTPTRFKKRLTEAPSAETTTALLQYEWDLFSKGFKHTARAIRAYLRSSFFNAKSLKQGYRRFPLMTSVESAALSWRRNSPKLIIRWNSYINRLSIGKTVIYCPKLQTTYSVHPIAQSVTVRSSLLGWQGLLQWFLTKPKGETTALVEVGPCKIAWKKMYLSSQLGGSYVSRREHVLGVRAVTNQTIPSRLLPDPILNRPRDLARRRVALRRTCRVV